MLNPTKVIAIIKGTWNIVQEESRSHTLSLSICLQYYKDLHLPLLPLCTFLDHPQCRHFLWMNKKPYSDFLFLFFYEATSSKLGKDIYSTRPESFRRELKWFILRARGIKHKSAVNTGQNGAVKIITKHRRDLLRLPDLQTWSESTQTGQSRAGEWPPSLSRKCRKD